MIEAEKAGNTTMTITRMCRLLGVDRRRFYEWRARQAAGLSARQQRDADLTARIVTHRKMQGRGISTMSRDGACRTTSLARLSESCARASAFRPD